MMKRMMLAGAAMAAAITAPAMAATYSEKFDEAEFSDWQSGWFGTNSDAANVYVLLFGGGYADYRGNNATGLYLGDTAVTDPADPIVITFTPDFAASLTSLSFDLAEYQAGETLTVFDKDGVVIGTQALTQATIGLYVEQGDYTSYAFTSANGIGGFSIGAGALGQTSIDNIVAVTADAAVPEPATWALFIGGFGMIGGALRRQKARVRYA